MEKQSPCQVGQLQYTPEIILSRLNKFRKEGKLCDVKIVVGDTEFLAHKLILAAFSPHLQDLFLKHHSGTKHLILNLDCADSCLVESILDYAYTTEIQITEHNVCAILHLAKFFKARPLLERCWRFVDEHLNDKNAWAFLELAHAYSHESLKEKAKTFVENNREEQKRLQNRAPKDSFLHVLRETGQPKVSSIKMAQDNLTRFVESVIQQNHQLTKDPLERDTQDFC